MSFSYEIKAELCRDKMKNSACALAEAYGVLLFAHTFTHAQVRVMTASVPFAQRLPRLFARAFGFEFDSVREPDEPPQQGSRQKAVFTVTDPGKLERIFAAFGADIDSTLTHHVNLAVLEDDGCRTAFLRGAFLAGGSMTELTARCHLEFGTVHAAAAKETQALLTGFGLEARLSQRGGTHSVIYFKRADAIADLLTMMGASACAMQVMNSVVEKEMRSAVNRRVNCDSANADKIVSAAQQQLDRIRELERTVGLQELTPELQQVAILRIANPEASLAELSELSEPHVSKSGIHHRMQKLMTMEF